MCCFPHMECPTTQAAPATKTVCKLCALAKVDSIIHVRTLHCPAVYCEQDTFDETLVGMQDMLGSAPVVFVQRCALAQAATGIMGPRHFK